MDMTKCLADITNLFSVDSKRTNREVLDAAALIVARHKKQLDGEERRGIDPRMDEMLIDVFTTFWNSPWNQYRTELILALGNLDYDDSIVTWTKDPTMVIFGRAMSSIDVVLQMSRGQNNLRDSMFKCLEEHKLSSSVPECISRKVIDILNFTTRSSPSSIADLEAIEAIDLVVRAFKSYFKKIGTPLIGESIGRKNPKMIRDDIEYKTAAIEGF